MKVAVTRHTPHTSCKDSSAPECDAGGLRTERPGAPAAWSGGSGSASRLDTRQPWDVGKALSPSPSVSPATEQGRDLGEHVAHVTCLKSVARPSHPRLWTRGCERPADRCPSDLVGPCSPHPFQSRPFLSLIHLVKILYVNNHKSSN